MFSRDKLQGMIQVRRRKRVNETETETKPEFYQKKQQQQHHVKCQFAYVAAIIIGVAVVVTLWHDQPTKQTNKQTNKKRVFLVTKCSSFPSFFSAFFFIGGFN